MSEIIQEVRYGLRSLQRAPGFTAVALLSLALGIGVNTTIFSFVNAILLRPLPVSEPESLIRIGSTSGGRGFFVVSHLEYRELAAQVGGLEAVTAHQVNSALLNVGEVPRQASIEVVSGNYFEVLGVEPRLGRGFLPEEDVTVGTHPVVVVSDRLWSERLAGDTAVVGRQVKINGYAFTVVGVAPPGFAGAFPGFLVDLWVPLMMQAQALPHSGPLDERGARFLNVIGRVSKASSRQEVEDQLEAFVTELQATHPDRYEAWGLTVADAAGVHPRLAGVATAFLATLMGMVALVLLIACANVANLSLARGSSRRRETEVRLALGASRWRLIRQHLVESGLLALGGGAGGLLLTFWARSLIGAFRPPAGLPVGLGLQVPVDFRVLTFSLAASATTALAFGLFPALQASRASSRVLGHGVHSAGGRRGGWVRSVLVVSQVAVSALLLIGAGLLLRSLVNSSGLDAGFEADDVVVVAGEASMLAHGETRTRELWNELRDGAAALPQARAVALGLFVPLGGRADQLIVTPADAADPGDAWDAVNYNVVTPGYFDLLGIPLVRGRDFMERDRSESPTVTVVNETMAARFWPGRVALGRRLQIRDRDGEERLAEVVGVASDITYRRLGEPPTPFFYLPYEQWYRMDLVLHVRAAGDPSELIGMLAGRLRAIEPELPLTIHTLSEEMQYSLTIPRIVAGVLGASGTIGLLLATLGIFGVVSYATTQRTHEIGVRMAVGADAASVRNLIVWQGMRLTLVGLVVGLGAAAFIARILRNLLYGVGSTDIVTYAAIALLLATVGALASYVPARRASGLDPRLALRSE